MRQRRRGEFSDETKEYLRKREGFSCQRCGRPGRTEVHHKIPLHIGNEKRVPVTLLSSVSNGEILCASCHREADCEVKDWDEVILQLFGVRMKQ